MGNMQKYCNEYWNHIKERFGDLPLSREAIKNSIIKYDIKDEMGYPGDPWQKMCCYQIASDGFDCDVARLTVLQYAIAFPYLLKAGWTIRNQSQRGVKWEFVNSEYDFKYRGDTMNSYNTTVHKYVGCWDESDILKKNRCYSACASYHAQEFIRLRDTVGNYIPVPFAYCGKRGAIGKEFNRPRGTSSAIQDYWDLTLYYIYSWYRAVAAGEPFVVANEKLKSLVKNSDESVELCSEWLKSFADKGKPSWQIFVKENYMQDFVEGSESELFGAPKVLWKGHFDPKAAVLPTKQQCEEFFQNASLWILARGERIAEAIMQKLEEVLGQQFWTKDEKKLGE